MKKIIALLTVICAIQLAGAQENIPRREIKYNVKYHWGFVDVMIARGNVVVQSDANGFSGTLDGTSIPWEGRIICVSDTLRATFDGTAPNITENVSYQSGWYRHPSVSQFQSSGYNPDDPAEYKSIAGGGTYDASHDSMEAITVTSDMLGIYYLANVIDFESLQPGAKLSFPINGKYSNRVDITYQGKGTYTADGDTYPTYNITFQYAYGGSMSGYDVDCQISVTDRIPVYLGASLPLGKVEMLYQPV